MRWTSDLGTNALDKGLITSTLIWHKIYLQ